MKTKYSHAVCLFDGLGYTRGRVYFITYDKNQKMWVVDDDDDVRPFFDSSEDWALIEACPVCSEMKRAALNAIIQGHTPHTAEHRETQKSEE